MTATLLLELVTILFRFGFRLQSTRDTAATVGVLTRGVRIHHGYLGVLLVLCAMPLRRHGRLYPRLLVSGNALLYSDLIHHFLVLWPVTGKHEFDLKYPCREA